MNYSFVRNINTVQKHLNRNKSKIVYNFVTNVKLNQF